MLIDLSHTVEDGMITYKGLPAPIVCDYLSRDAAESLRAAGATLVGIDSYNIDDTDDPARPVHTTLLAAEIPIVEHLTGLERLPDDGSRFFAVPVKVKGMGTFPVRAFGIIIE